MKKIVPNRTYRLEAILINVPKNDLILELNDGQQAKCEMMKNQR